MNIILLLYKYDIFKIKIIMDLQQFLIMFHSKGKDLVYMLITEPVIGVLPIFPEFYKSTLTENFQLLGYSGLAHGEAFSY